MKFAGTVQVMEAEMVGIAEALSSLKQLPVSDVVIEIDCELCVNAINGDNTNLLELGNLVQQCKSVVCSRGGVLVDFIRKQVNRVTRMIARIPCFLDFMSPPSFLLETLLSDFLIF